MDTKSIILWVCFALAVILVGAMGIMYCVMRSRKRKMQLQQAIAEGKVSIKSYDEDGADGREGS